MLRIYKITMLVLAGSIFILFFITWIGVDSGPAEKVSRIFVKNIEVPVTEISGFEIPVMANGKDAKLMIKIAKIFYPDIEGVDKKSWFVWVVPILAQVFLIVALLLGKNKWIALILGFISIAIFVFALYKISITDLDKTVLHIRIAGGLWLTLFCFFTMGLLSLIKSTEGFLKK